MTYRSAIISILLAVCAQAQDLAKSRDFFDLIRNSQNLLAEAKPIEAEEGLIRWETDHPEIRKNPMFCYQRFFIALEGRGDRETAKLMLSRLDALVSSGTLSANSSMYRSVTQAWNKALFHTDSDLPRQAHLIMQSRLESQNHQ
jgi:hypothetical protein